MTIQGVDLLLLLKDKILLLLDVASIHLRDIRLLALGLAHRILWVQRIIWSAKPIFICEDSVYREWRDLPISQRLWEKI